MQDHPGSNPASLCGRRPTSDFAGLSKLALSREKLLVSTTTEAYTHAWFIDCSSIRTMSIASLRH